MLKTNNVNKYYNKKKQNELHVLKDVNIALEDIGFVVIKGKSGSGKTTLLNSICGLDKVNNGEISINDYTFKKYDSNKWDNIRNKEFGYIFQNYNIFDDESVFNNVSLSLEMLGLKDKDEIKERVMNALRLVGLEKYRNRLAGNLSGGEQQRVAIARAIVKNPRIIIADEPTGNLDEKNTIMIMNILKKISTARLVVVVTHEKDIADFYADKIVNIVDGSISSIEDATSSELKLQTDDTIYLKDMVKEESSNNTIKLTTYHDSELNEDIDIRLIVKDGNLLVDVNSTSLKIKYQSSSNAVKIVDDHKKTITKEDIKKQIEEVEILPIDNQKLSGKYNIGFIKYLKKGFERIFDLSKFKKTFFIGFFISSFLLMVSLSAYFGVSKIDESSFLFYDRDLIELNYKTTGDYAKRYDELVKLKEDGIIDGFYSRTNSNADVVRPIFTQVGNSYINSDVVGSYIDASKANYVGKKPSQGEVVLDQLIANYIFKNSLRYGNTIKNNDILLTTSLIFANREYKIVDIVDTNNGCIYVNQADYIHFLSPTKEIYDGSLAGIQTLKNDEVILNANNPIYYGIVLDGMDEKVTVSGKSYKVLGYFEGDSITEYYFNEHEFYYQIAYEGINNGILDLSTSKNPKEVISLVKGLGYKNVDMRYNIDYKEARQDKYFIINILFIITIVTIIAPLIFLYFLMRSSMISRIKEIGIYRALGMKKASIIKMHASEIVAISIIGTIPGWLIGVIVVIKASIDVKTVSLFSTSPFVMLSSLLISFMINLLVGCIPILSLMRKTPKEILAKYDI